MTLAPTFEPLESDEELELTPEDIAVLEALAADPPEDAWDEICVECGNDHSCMGYILCSDCLEDDKIVAGYEDIEAPTGL